MPKLTDTQTIILTRAASRPGNLALPLPKGLAGAAAKMTVGKMIERGWLAEVDANLRRKEPLWRETGDGHGTTLIATEAGLDAIGIDPVVASTVSNIRKARLAAKSTEVAADASAGPKLVSIRQGTKQALLIDMLQRPEGASITECVFRGSWAVISRDLGHAFHGIAGSHFTIVGRLVDKVHRVSLERFGQGVS